MKRSHDKIGMACASACIIHCCATTAFLLAGGSLVTSGWLEASHDLLMPMGLLMVALGIVPALWQHRSTFVAVTCGSGLLLWGLALMDSSHGMIATVLEIVGAGCLLAAHGMNMIAARRLPVGSMPGKESKRAAGIAEIG